MSKRCAPSDDIALPLLKRHKSDEVYDDCSSEGDNDDDDSSWAPSEDGDEEGDAVGDSSLSCYGTRSRGSVEFPSDNVLLLDQVDAVVESESDPSSEEGDECCDEESESEECCDEESESEDDEYSDDDSFVTSDEEEDGSPSVLTRCDAGIPDSYGVPPDGLDDA